MDRLKTSKDLTNTGDDFTIQTYGYNVQVNSKTFDSLSDADLVVANSHKGFLEENAIVKGRSMSLREVAR